MYRCSAHQGYTRYASLTRAVVFITGGASGIGAALVEAFVVQGAAVAFVDVDTVSARQLCDRLERDGLARPWFQSCDVSKIDKLREALLAARNDLGNITVLINNAADDQRYDTDRLTEQQWHDSLAINLHPAFFAAQTVKPMMVDAGEGCIINIGSVNSRFSQPDLASYVTAKAGLSGMTRALATDYGVHNIRVNTISPGWVATQKQLANWLTPEQEEEWMRRVCIKMRLGVHDVAKAALFLASADAAMITSQELVVDGGRFQGGGAMA